MAPRLANQTRLRAYIEAEAGALRGTLRLYVRRAGLAQGDAVAAAADDLLNEVVVEALTHAQRFRPDGQPKAWLLGIAANLVRRRQADRARRERREPLVADLGSPGAEGAAAADAGAVSEAELFDRLARSTARQAEPEAALEADEAAAALLALVSPADRQVLRLAILHELNGEMLAGALRVSPGAARVRLHRALNRLRAALAAQEGPHE